MSAHLSGQLSPRQRHGRSSVVWRPLYEALRGALSAMRGATLQARFVRVRNC